MKKHIYEESNRLSYTMPVSESAQTGTISVCIDDGRTDRTFEPGRSGGQRAGGNLGKADGGETGCDRTTENAGSDEMGWIDE